MTKALMFVIASLRVVRRGLQRSAPILNRRRADVAPRDKVSMSQRAFKTAPGV